MSGYLYIIPSPISDNSSMKELSPQSIDILMGLDEFIVEKVRTARRFLKKAGYTAPIDNIKFHVLDKQTQESSLPLFIENARNGKSIGIISESGCPCIADPGAKIVSLAHKYGITVKPLVGPSSILLALIASGFNGQSFAFHGYLPIDGKQLQKKLKDIENLAVKNNQTQIFMETPYRNNRLIDIITSSLYPSTMLCIASELTKTNEFIKTMSISEWKSQIPDLNKKNSVFLIYH